MNIGLIDVDGHNFPNLALMKISSFHKKHGDDVEWWNGFQHYDKVYINLAFLRLHNRIEILMEENLRLSKDGLRGGAICKQYTRA